MRQIVLKSYQRKEILIMKKIDSFTNKYQLSKTLCFSLLPEGNTELNFDEKMMLKEDEERAEAYGKVKNYIDRFHKEYIEEVLSNFVLDGVREYSKLYYKSGKNTKEISEMEKQEKSLRKSISKQLKSDTIYKKLFSKVMIDELLPEFLTVEEELATVKMFHNFSTYFSGFHENRKNIYSEEKQNAIPYRCINENLPMFLDNAKNFLIVKEVLSANELQELNDDFWSTYGVLSDDVFSIDYFSFVLSQSGIDKYNGVIGGYTCSDGTKIQGINEHINLYNQQVAKRDRSKRLPFMKPLYKQILSKESTVSFIPEQFKSDNEVLTAINDYYDKSVKDVVSEIKELFVDFDSFNSEGVHVLSGVAITELSKAVFGSWNAVVNGWNDEYELAHPLKKGKDPEKYYNVKDKEYKKNKSFSIAEIQRLGSKCAVENCVGNIVNYYKDEVPKKADKIQDSYSLAQQVLTQGCTVNNDKKLCKNDKSIEIIKSLLDSIKDLENTIKPLTGTGKEENKDAVFYGKFTSIYEKLSEYDRLYDKVRNYITAKPYSKDKIKLNFENPQLLGGWDKNKERDYRTVLLVKNNKYYLAIMDKSNNKAFINPPNANGEASYKKVEYKLLPGPNKMLPKVFFATSNKDVFAPPEEILEIRTKESFKKGENFNVKDCHKFIDYFKKSINEHKDWSKFGFDFSSTENYKDISEFYNEVEKQGYSLKFVDIPESYINDLVNKGELYLFQIYNKDFSEYSKGKKIFIRCTLRCYLMREI